VWDDIRELTSGYFAGDEALRDVDGKRTHVQQTPVALLLRIILSSSKLGDIIFDPTAGTGTALVVAKQLKRNSIGIEIDPAHIKLINNRLATQRAPDCIYPMRKYYRFTAHLDDLWQTTQPTGKQSKLP
jgi:DNA modification methylase